jgi:hypothetical protein
MMTRSSQHTRPPLCSTPRPIFTAKDSDVETIIADIDLNKMVGYYSHAEVVGQSVSSLKRSAPVYGFSKTKRFPSRSGSSVPGPVYHTNPKKTISGPKFSTSPRDNAVVKLGPGPGHYNSKYKRSSTYKTVPTSKFSQSSLQAWKKMHGIEQVCDTHLTHCTQLICLRVWGPYLQAQLLTFPQLAWLAALACLPMLVMFGPHHGPWAVERSPIRLRMNQRGWCA